MRANAGVFCFGFTACWLTSSVLTVVPNKEEVDAKYWQKQGSETLKSSLKLRKLERPAKNVIFFLGDGMGIPTVTAMRIYKGQKANKTGEEEQLSFDKFPHVSLSKTYALDRQLPDSANTATAYLCGVKANYGTLGVDGHVTYEDCASSIRESNQVTSILQWAQQAGKWTGFVTSTRVTHATPAGLYAHSACRDWEASTPDARCKDITTQLVHGKPGKDINVIFGGGRKTFLPNSSRDIEGKSGIRNDTRDLIAEWIKTKQNEGKQAKAIFDYEGLKNLDKAKINYALGLFHSDHLPYVTDRSEQPLRQPSLVELTKAAIEILQKSDKGFFLLVEGGRIDQAHHSNLARKALEEGVEFDDAVQAAIDMTKSDETLIVVTADHSHTFTISGDYPARGSNIVGLGGNSDVDNLTMTIVSYANGPGYKSRSENLTQQKVLDKEYQQDVTFPTSYETHGAEDVAVFATGPMAHLFHGVHEQSYIPYVLGYALCVGPNVELCSSCSQTISSFTLISVCIFIFIAIKSSSN